MQLWEAGSLGPLPFPFGFYRRGCVSSSCSTSQLWSGPPRAPVQRGGAISLPSGKRTGEERMAVDPRVMLPPSLSKGH